MVKGGKKMIRELKDEPDILLAYITISNEFAVNFHPVGDDSLLIPDVYTFSTIFYEAKD